MISRETQLAESSSHQAPKQQQLAFNSVDAARKAYLGHIAQLEINGFIEG